MKRKRRININDVVRIMIIVMFVYGIGFAAIHNYPAAYTAAHKVFGFYQNSSGPIKPEIAISMSSLNGSEIEGAMTAYAIGSNVGTNGFSAGTQPGQLNLMPLNMVIYAVSPGPSSMSIKMGSTQTLSNYAFTNNVSYNVSAPFYGIFTMSITLQNSQAGVTKVINYEIETEVMKTYISYLQQKNGQTITLLQTTFFGVQLGDLTIEAVLCFASVLISYGWIYSKARRKGLIPVVKSRTP